MHVAMSERDMRVEQDRQERGDRQRDSERVERGLLEESPARIENGADLRGSCARIQKSDGPLEKAPARGTHAPLRVLGGRRAVEGNYSSFRGNSL